MPKRALSEPSQVLAATPIALRPFSTSLPHALLIGREHVMRGFKGIIDQHGLSEQQWRVVRALAEHPEMDAGKLANATGLLNPSLTRILAALERRHILVRERRKTDKRYISIKLTQTGQRLFREIAPKTEIEYQRIESIVGKDNLKTLLELLGQLESVSKTTKP